MSIFAGILHFSTISTNDITARDMAQASSLRSAQGDMGLAAWQDAHLTCAIAQAAAIQGDRTLQTRLLAYRHLLVLMDGALYNQPDLAAALPDARHAPTDDAVLLAEAYLAWGVGCAARLYGEFSAVVWDSQARQLFALRDHVGTRPFFYRQTADALVFANDLRALLAYGEAPAAYDPYPVAAYLLHHPTTASPRTFFAGITRLLDGHWLLADAARVQTKRYWSPFAVAVDPKLRCADYVPMLRAALEEAVQVRLPEAHPVAAHLSGGLDSSGVMLLAHYALQQKNRRLASAYSWSPPLYSVVLQNKDERSSIAAIAQAADVPLIYADYTEDDFYALLQANIALESILILIAEKSVLRDAEQRGVRLIFSGWGGDEGVTHKGQGVLPQWALRGRWRRLWREVRQYKNWRGRAALRMASTQILSPLMPAAIYFRLRPEVHQAPGYIQPAFATEMQGQMPPRFRVTANAAHTQRSLLARGHIAERLEGWAAWGAAHGVRYTYPLLDRRVLELALSLPPAETLHNGQVRYPYRMALAGILPDEIRLRPGKAEPAQMQRLVQQSSSMWQLLASTPQRLDDLTQAANMDWVDVRRLRADVLHTPASAHTVLQWSIILRALRVARLGTP